VTDSVECICGVDIHKVKDVWVDDEGGGYCYPDDPDASDAEHEPLDWNIQ
jgi:hypothetical protein